MPNDRSSVSVTSAIVELDQDLPLRHVELLQRRLDHRVFGRRGDDQDGVVVLVGDDLDVAHDADAAIGSDRRVGQGPGDRLRDRPAGRARLRALLLDDRRRGCGGIGTDDEGCAWKLGGETMVPAGVPGASVGAPAVVCWVVRPVNACCSSGPMRSARLFCT